jgi:hypothetical protein
LTGSHNYRHNFHVSGINGPDIAAVYQLLTQVARTVTGHDRKLDERVRRIERHLRLEPAGG